LTSIIFGESLIQKPIVNCIVKYAKGYPTFIDVGAGDDPFQYIKFMKEFGYQTYDLRGTSLSASKLARLCKLGIHDPFVVMEFFSSRNDL